MEVARGRGRRLDAEREAIKQELEAVLDDKNVDVEAYADRNAWYASTLCRLKRTQDQLAKGGR